MRGATCSSECNVQHGLQASARWTTKAAATDRSISELVNGAVKSALTEDAEDLAAFDERKSERSASFESLVRDLRKRGRI